MWRTTIIWDDHWSELFRCLTLRFLLSYLSGVLKQRHMTREVTCVRLRNRCVKCHWAFTKFDFVISCNNYGNKMPTKTLNLTFNYGFLTLQKRLCEKEIYQPKTNRKTTFENKMNYWCIICPKIQTVLLLLV